MISCQNGISKKNGAQPKENIIPSAEDQKTKKTLPKLDQQKPTEKPLNKEVKKNKLKAMDTLKPIVAIP